MASRAEQKLNTRQKIMDAAVECFAEQGYAACSVADIMERAGVSKGCLYVHFKSKEELFLAMIDREHAMGTARAKEAAKKPPYLDGVVWFMKESITHSGIRMENRLWAEVLAVAARDSAVRERFIASERVARKFLVDLLAKAAEAGEIDASLDLDAVSIWIFSLGDGLIARVADDLEFDFKKQFKVFQTLVRRALRP